MPYVSPRGNVKEKIPPKKAPTNTTDGISAPHQPSAELGEILASRDIDPAVVDSMDHWSGWKSPQHVIPDEDELYASIDPLDELKQKVATKSTTTSTQNQTTSVEAIEGSIKDSERLKNEDDKILTGEIRKDGSKTAHNTLQANEL